MTKTQCFYSGVAGKERDPEYLGLRLIPNVEVHVLALIRREPVLVMLAVRALFYALGTYFAFQVEPEASEAFAAALLTVLGVDTATTLRARSKVTPTDDPRL